MNRERDSQRSKVYAWGWEISPGGTLTLAECVSLVAEICMHYGQPLPRVTDGRGHRNAAYYPTQHRVDFPRSARTVRVVLHECAHALMGRTVLAVHGPHFVRLYMDLLVAYGGENLNHLEDLARAHKVTAGDRTCTRPLPCIRSFLALGAGR